MGEMNVISSAWSFGEIDPKLAARVDFAAYARGVKTASNVLSIPQGGFTRRFGTRYVATISATSYKYIELYSFVYDNEAVYCMVFTNNSIAIYLENTLNATVVTTYPAAIVQQLSFTQIENRLIILHKNFPSSQLIRSSAAANIIAAIDAVNDFITLTVAVTAGRIYPLLFTTAGTLPVTDPQIYVDTIYYAKFVTANNIRIYSTPEDAAADVNRFNIIALGGGVSNVLLQSVFTLSTIPYSVLPSFDFDAFATYSAIGFTFTASAVSGTVGVPANITASAPVFTTAHVGGLFIGNGGVLRITGFTSNVIVSGYTYEDFLNTTAFPGSESYLGEPAWSPTRGYPSCGTFFQERFFVAGSRAIPNGLWGSTLNAVYDFNDAESLADSAISFYPSAGSSNYIKALTSSKSLIVHSNTGNYSTPLSTDLPLTPSGFSLTEQNKDGISNVIPVFIDNQIIYVDRSGRNIKSMFWDIIQSSYVNTNISLPSSHLVQTPLDMAVFSEPSFSDGYYVLAINEDGTMALYNSLTEQDIKAWTKADTAQNATAGYFRRVTAGLNRAWVIVERTVSGSTVLMLEELDFDYPVDSGVAYTNSPATATLTGLGHLEGQSVQVFADGCVLENETVTGGQIVVESAVSTAVVGLQFSSLVETLPININLQTGPNLYQKQHVRVLYIHYYLSVGMTIQGFDIPTQEVQQVILNEPAIPATGVLSYTLMEAWDAFDYTIQISQTLPLPMTLLAVGYDVEI
jgi:hypothetical protein